MEFKDIQLYQHFVNKSDNRNRVQVEDIDASHEEVEYAPVDFNANTMDFEIVGHTQMIKGENFLNEYKAID